MHDYDVKASNATLYVGRERKKIFLSLFNLYKIVKNSTPGKIAYIKPPRIGHFWGYPPGMCSGDKERQSWKQLSVPIVP